MKAILMSIRPKWCELIINNKKTIEVRKTKPKIKNPFKVYIYCTKSSKSRQTVCGSIVLNDDELYKHPQQGIKYGNSIELMGCDDYGKDNFLNGKVIGEFVCDNIITVDCDSVNPFNKETKEYINNETCLSRNDFWEYTHGICAYGWHISDLKIYDKPKDLSEFGLTRPPQSWCYCEENK
jgi:predicted transcriptional regulator